MVDLTNRYNYPQYISIVGYSYPVGKPVRQREQTRGTLDSEHDLYQTNFSLTWKAVCHPLNTTVQLRSCRVTYEGLRGCKGNSFHMISGYINGLDHAHLLGLEAKITQAYENAGRHCWMKSLWKPEELRTADDWKYQNRVLASHWQGLRLVGNPASVGSSIGVREAGDILPLLQL